MTGNRLRAAAAVLCALLGASACQGTPSAMVPGHDGTAPAPGTRATARHYLYATTLDWNAGNGSVYYYDAYDKSSSPVGSLAITSGFPDGVWTDGHGNVYVAIVNSSTNNGRGYINEYTPGFGKLLATYTKGLDGPSGGTFDSAGNMYVANLCGTAPSGSCYVFARPGRRLRATGSTTGYVAIYPAGKTQPSAYLSSAINIAVNVAIDKSKNVFVVNNTGGIAWNVIEFPAGKSQGQIVPFRGLPQQHWVGADTFDPSGALVVSVNSAIDFFPHERGKPAHSLTKGVVVADGLSYGPDGTLFAGNYEYISNEGNIVAFPPSATAPARTYAVPYGNGVVSVAIGSAR